MNFSFDSRRSPVYATRGMVASSQPLASQAGLSILMQGGNAADAAVATAAALNVTEPTSTGIGGDVFALYFDAATREVTALNASGRAPAALSIRQVEQDGQRGPNDEMADPFHAHTITVPGACAGWCDFVARHGSLNMRDVLAPAIRLAEDGFPVAPLTAHAWARGVERQKMADRGRALTINGRAPRAGEIFRNPDLGRTFRAVADGGAQAFYEGEIGRRIVEANRAWGGVMTHEDLLAHTSTWDTPISTTYKGVRVWECPPNGQGLTALLTLNIIEGLDVATMKPAQYWHTVIEALRIAFADTRWFVADPAFNPAPLAALLSKEYAAQRRGLINPNKATLDTKHGSPVAGSNTVYFCVVDGAGNAASFINSNYAGFGTGIVPEGCGFTLQNRGHNFSLDASHPNALEPRKRPYHTIIPGLLTRDVDVKLCEDDPSPTRTNELVGPFGVMGGFMQPQGHMQVVMNLLDRGMDPQDALNAPRICLEPGEASGAVLCEDGLGADVIARLGAMGHDAREVTGVARSVFGRGQIILRNEHGVLQAGSDPRADGCAMGF